MAKPDLGHKGRQVEAEMRTAATPGQVYAAWADPERVAQWFVDKAAGEAKPGATVTWTFEKFNFSVPYTVLAADAGERFAIGFSSPEKSGICEVNIAREGGETVLRLVNSGFKDGAEWEDEYQGVNSGWQCALAVLKHYLENYYGRPKRQALAVRQFRLGVAELQPWFREPGRHVRWLTGPISEALVGELLCDSGRELAYAWPQREAVFELKAFWEKEGKAMAGLRVLSWASDPQPDLENELAAAVERLAAAIEG